MPEFSGDVQGNDYEVRWKRRPLLVCVCVCVFLGVNTQQQLSSSFKQNQLSNSPVDLVCQALLAFEERQGAVVSKKLSRREIQRFPTKTFQSASSAGNTQ